MDMSVIDKERAAMCALNRLMGYDPIAAHRLLGALDTASAIFELDRRSRQEVLGPYSKHTDALTREAVEQAWEELEGLFRQGYRFVCCTDPDYPALLKECEDAPVGLYVRSGSPLTEVFGKRPEDTERLISEGRHLETQYIAALDLAAFEASIHRDPWPGPGFPI